MKLKALEILETLRDDYYDCYERGLAEENSWKHIDEAIEELESFIKSYEHKEKENVALYCQSMSILNSVKSDKE